MTLFWEDLLGQGHVRIRTFVDAHLEPGEA